MNISLDSTDFDSVGQLLCHIDEKDPNVDMNSMIAKLALSASKEEGIPAMKVFQFLKDEMEQYQKAAK